MTVMRFLNSATAVIKTEAMDVGVRTAVACQ